MGSTRLPGKVLAKIDENNTVLKFLINQLKFSTLLDEIIIATSNAKINDEIENFANQEKIKCFRGDEQNVLDRFFQCAKEFQLENIVRITADNPLVDPKLIDMAIQEFQKNKVDYLTNSRNRTFPYGTEIEIFTFSALLNAWKNAEKKSEQEHVTPYFYNNPNIFSIHDFTHSKNLSHYRYTIDHQNDLKLVKAIISKIENRPILMKDVISIFEISPKLLDINKNNKPNEDHINSIKLDYNLKY
jgi:spore coat polysaccharide biosynthesis protein SpsF